MVATAMFDFLDIDDGIHDHTVDDAQNVHNEQHERTDFAAAANATTTKAAPAFRNGCQE